MTKFVFAILALCLIQAATSFRVARDAPAQANPLEELQKRASEIAANLDASFNKLVGVQNDEERNQLLKANTDNFLNKVGELSQTLKEKTAETQGKVQTVLSDALSGINATVTDIKNKNPEVEKKTEEIANNFKSSFASVTEQLQNIGKGFAESSQTANADVKNAIQKSYSGIVDAAEQLQKQLRETANNA